MTTNPHITRFRRRIPPPDSPHITLPLRSSSSEGATIRDLRVAFEETPIKLRELEEGWRERRRVGLRELTGNGAKGDRVMAGEGKDGSKADGVGRLPRVRLSKQPRADEEVPTKGTGARPQPPHIPPGALPSPPPTPPPISTQIRPPKAVPIPSIADHSPPAPLLSSPLPPTPRPVRLTSRSSDTIQIHTSISPIGITLSLRKDTQLVRLAQDGRLITFTSSGSSSASKREQSRQLGLAQWEEWSEGDKRDWELVRRLVEGYKRHTPKVRLYLPLGHLTTTCSSPPDVVLDFTHTSTPSGNDRVPASGLPTTKVRIRLSRLANDLTIDTASADTTIGERLRSKRSIRLPRPSSDLSVPPIIPGGDAYGLQAILKRADGWGEAEQEGLRRLWELREEWERYG